MCIFNCTVKQLYSFSVADMEIQYNSFFCDNSMTWHNMEQRAAFPVRRQLNYNRVPRGTTNAATRTNPSWWYILCPLQWTGTSIFSDSENVLKEKNTDIFSDSKVLLGTVLIKKARKPWTNPDLVCSGAHFISQQSKLKCPIWEMCQIVWNCCYCALNFITWKWQ